MAVKAETPKHRVLREVYRHYLEFRDLFQNNGTHVIDYGYYVYDSEELSELVGDKEWGKVLEEFEWDELLATGGVEEVPVLNIDCTPKLDEDDDELVTLKPLVTKVKIKISLWDLQNGLQELSPRKREAVFYNVILDKKQKDVAEKMGITTVSVGQYVEQAMLQLSERYFAEMVVEEE